MEKTFAKGIHVTSKTFDNGGEIIKLGINMIDFCENNPTNEKGYINIDLKKSKNDKWYAELNTYKKHDNTNIKEDYAEDEEIPF